MDQRPWGSSIHRRAGRSSVGCSTACPPASCTLWLMLLALAAASGCAPSDPRQPEPPPPKVLSTLASTRDTLDYDEFVGRTEPSESVEVRSRLTGFLRTIEFEDGALVEQGDLLATIEEDQYKAVHQQSVARVELWQAKLELAQATLARSKLLIEKNAIAQEEFEESAAAVRESQAQVAAATADADRTALDLKYSEIRAPIAGRIDRALLTPGNLLTSGLGAGTLLTRIVRDAPLHVYLDVDERSVLRYLRKSKSQINAGSSSVALSALKIPCEISLQDEEGFPHSGLLDFVENRVDATTGTIRLRAVFENADGLLRGGLFVRARIPATSQPVTAVLIPEMAIGLDQGESFVYVIDEQARAMRRTVELGTLSGSLRTIRSGIAAGEEVIVQGVQRVRPGMRVAATRQDFMMADAQVNHASVPDALVTGTQPASAGPGVASAQSLAIPPTSEASSDR